MKIASIHGGREEKGFYVPFGGGTACRSRGGEFKQRKPSRKIKHFQVEVNIRVARNPHKAQEPKKKRQKREALVLPGDSGGGKTVIR